MKPPFLISAAFTLAITVLHAQLIESASAPPPTAAKLAAESIVAAINNEITHRVAVHKIAFDTLWKNTREGATPAAILEQLGTSAVLVFQFSRENLDHIDRCAKLVGKTRADFLSDAECTPPHELVYHADGRVTLKP
jgi:hypothetical protein